MVEFFPECNYVEQEMVRQRGFRPRRVNRISKRIRTWVKFLQFLDNLLNVTEAAEMRISPIAEALLESKNGFDAFEQHPETMFRENVPVRYDGLAI